MPNLVNRLVSAEYASLLGGAEGLLVVSFAGVSVEESEKIRAAMEEGGARLRMVRNSLAHRALCELGYEFPADVFTGNVCVAWGSAEAVIHAAKVLTSKEAKKAGEVKVRGGMMESTQLGAADAVALADVPDKNTLRGQFLGVLQGPARGLATMLNGLPSGLARVLQAHSDQGADDQGADGQEAEAS